MVQVQHEIVYELSIFTEIGDLEMTLNGRNLVSFYRKR